MNGAQLRQNLFMDDRATCQAWKRAQDLTPIVDAIKAEGAISLRQIAEGLNSRGIKTARNSLWSAIQVPRVLLKTVFKDIR